MRKEKREKKKEILNGKSTEADTRAGLLLSYSVRGEHFKCFHISAITWNQKE